MYYFLVFDKIENAYQNILNLMECKPFRGHFHMKMLPHVSASTPAPSGVKMFMWISG